MFDFVVKFLTCVVKVICVPRVRPSIVGVLVWEMWASYSIICEWSCDSRLSGVKRVLGDLF